MVPIPEMVSVMVPSPVKGCNNGPYSRKWFQYWSLFEKEIAVMVHIKKNGLTIVNISELFLQKWSLF